MNTFRVFLIFTTDWRSPDNTVCDGMTSQQFDMRAMTEWEVELKCRKIDEDMQKQGCGLSYSIICMD